MDSDFNNPECRNWILGVFVHKFAADSVRNYVAEKFEDFYKNDEHLSAYCPCIDNEHKGSCENHDNDSHHSPNFMRKSEKWELVTKPPCHPCTVAFDKIIELFVNKQSGKINWKNLDKFRTVFDSSWNIANVFMSRGNGYISDKSKTDPAAIYAILSSCNLFDVRADILDTLRDSRNKLMHSATYTMNEHDKENLFRLVRKLLRGLPMGMSCEIEELEKMKTMAVTANMFEKAQAEKMQFLVIESSLHGWCPIDVLQKSISSIGSDKQSEINKLNKEIQELNATSSEKEREIDRLMKENRELNESLATSSEKEREIDRLMKENRELNESLATSSEKEREIDRLMKENRELNESLATSSEKEREIDRLMEENRELNERCVIRYEKERKLFILLKENRELKESLDNIRSEKERQNQRGGMIPNRLDFLGFTLWGRSTP